MYNIQNESLVFYLWRTKYQKSYRIGNEKDLIKFLASLYRERIWFGWWEESKLTHLIFDNFTCYDNEAGDSTLDTYLIFDGCMRYINPKLYEQKAYDFYVKFIKNKEGDKYNYFSKSKSKKEYGVFRKTPVPGIHKYRGGPKQKPRKVKHIEMMYDNPDFKGFNRGNSKRIAMDDYYYDWFPARRPQKSWKKHRKHQWK
jgi:hypothetical protein